MAHLFNRNVLLGVSGGIAAYKSAELVRELQERGAQVRVIMTHGAQEFITPLTLQALSGNPVHTELLDEAAELGMGHIELARWADLLLIAPATADLIARLSTGRADDLLTTVALATAAPLMLAPAMNQQMWKGPATTANINVLLERGVRVVGPAEGLQACGDVGPGRMETPATIADAAGELFPTGELAGKRVVITAGPTREALDPVRYISNNSSGKMGYALAQAAVDAGATTTLISGPVNLAAPDHTRVLDVLSAEEMLEQIKKGPQEITLQLERTPDIVAIVAANEHRPYTVGFAAETNDVLAYAREKMQRKGLDMIIANDVADPSIGFNSNDNAVTVVRRDGEQILARASKSIIARQIVHLIATEI
jgi:phosphopantothenoylcysteine decarboxylase/phosphopantothenate--cysteine ligase